MDWKYVANRDSSTLKQEAVWIGLQKVRVLVDLTSGVNLFPDLRLTNNIEPDYARSMASVRDVMEKMQILGAHDLIVPLQRFVENNFSQQAAWDSFDTSMREICREAESRHITVYLRMAPYQSAKGYQRSNAVHQSGRCDQPASGTEHRFAARCKVESTANSG